jgi:acetylornithine/succinyldiaminopimelate/putrescine aminotransferase
VEAFPTGYAPVGIASYMGAGALLIDRQGLQALDLLAGMNAAAAHDAAIWMVSDQGCGIGSNIFYNRNFSKIMCRDTIFISQIL